MSEKKAKAAKKTSSEMSVKEKFNLHEAKYGVGNVVVMQVEDKIAYLKRIVPSAIYAKAMGHMTPIPGIKNDPDPVTAGMVVMLGCWIEGDDELKIDPEYSNPATMQAVGLLKMKTASMQGNF